MLAAMRFLGPIALSFFLLSSCAYRRHTTPLHLESEPRLAPEDRPANLYTFRLLSAQVPDRKLSGLSWDDDGSGPDPFARLYIDDRLVWESEVKQNQIGPEWNAVLPRNVAVSPQSDFRLELWDFDSAVSADPIGRIERRGLPTVVVPDAMARLPLDRGSLVVVMVTAPRPHRGVGVTVEVRPDALKVLSVEPYSPAARAGIKVSDLIVGIANERISHMTEADAISELSLASDRTYKLRVADAEGANEHDVALDKGYTWLTM